MFLTQINFVYPEIFKPNVSNRFLVQNYLLNLCSRGVNSQRLFCSQKAKNVRIKDFWYTKSKAVEYI